MTVLLVLLALAVLAVFGLAPAWLLLPRDSSGHRILLLPVLGLCAVVLIAGVLASVGLTGRGIALLALLLGGASAVSVLLRPILARRPRRCSSTPAGLSWADELYGAAPVLLIGIASMGLIAWPSFAVGHLDYWGLANPDQAYYMHVVERLESHSIGGAVQQDPRAQHRSPGTSAVLGVLYLLHVLSALTGIPAKFLFGQACATMVCLAPVSIYYLAAHGFALSRRVALTIAVASAPGSLVANAFYLSALGSLTVVVIAPVGLAFLLQYLRRPGWRWSVATAVAVAAMYYCYYPGAAVMGIVFAFLVLWKLVRGAISPRQLAPLVSCIAVLTPAVFFSQFTAILSQLYREALSSRLAADPSNEILMFFALTLTEQVVPFFWGLKLPHAAPGLWADPAVSFGILFSFGGVLFVILAAAVFTRAGGLGGEYAVTLAASLLPLVAYTLGRNGYGVFKLVGWIHPVMLAGFGAAVLGLSRVLAARGWRPLAVVPLAFGGGYMLLNFQQTIRMGIVCHESRGGTVHNAPSFRLKAFRDLAEVERVWGASGLDVAVPDPVIQRWMVPFLASPKHQFFPIIDLEVDDSDSAPARKRLRDAEAGFHGGMVLHLAGDQARSGTPCRPAWANGNFAVTDTRSCENLMVLGSGWYRTERHPTSRIPWQRDFRWLRRRGEILVFNPSPSPQCLVLTLVAGYGNQSPCRTVRLFLNGRQFDEIRFCAYARVASRAFVAPRPWSRIELEVVERAAPLPREHFALWNRWVPSDPRLLNVALAELSISDERVAESDLPTAVDLTDPEQFRRAQVSGIFPDRWIGSEATIKLALRDGAGRVEIRGFLPSVEGLKFPCQIALEVNGVPVGVREVPHPGSFALHFPLYPAVGSKLDRPAALTLLVRPAATFSAGDGRQKRNLSVLVDRIGITAATPPAGARQKASHVRRRNN